ncbi:MAG: hypothetical protein AB7O52_02990 [Planctomycetota bacterium]
MTLLELLLVVAVVGALSTTLWLTTSTVLARTDGNRARENRIQDVRATLSEITRAIRLADEVPIATNGELVVRSRYFADDDDELERVRYVFKTGGLYRQVALDGVSYDAGTLILRDIDAFAAFNFRLIDSFEPSVYGVNLLLQTVGDVLSYDTAVQTVYDVLSLGAVDLDLVSSYDESLGAVVVRPLLGLGGNVTVAPTLPGEDLSIRTRFTPQGAGGEYALVYGDADDGVLLVFKSDGTLALQRTSGGSVQGQSAIAGPWEVGRTYDIALSFDEAMATTIIRDGTNVLGQARVGRGSVRNGKVHFVGRRDLQAGQWDDLFVGWDLVRVDLTLDLGAGAESFVLKVGPRSW